MAWSLNGDTIFSFCHCTQIYHLRECTAVAWREHARLGRGLQPYTDRAAPSLNPWHGVWCNSLRLVTALVETCGQPSYGQQSDGQQSYDRHSYGQRSACLNPAFDFVLANVDHLRVTLLRWVDTEKSQQA